jgi:hypothetical protein
MTFGSRGGTIKICFLISGIRGLSNSKRKFSGRLYLSLWSCALELFGIIPIVEDHPLLSYTPLSDYGLAAAEIVKDDH